MSRSSLSLFVVAGASLVIGAVACDAGSDSVFGSNKGGEGGEGGMGGGVGGSTGGEQNITIASNGGTGNVNTCDSGDDEDADMDGYSFNDGDCNDCDPNVNPSAIEVAITEPDDMGMIPEPVDEDCDSIVDNVPELCDAGLAIEDADPMSGAKAVDLCQIATDGKWGVISAQYVQPDGSPAPASASFARGFGLVPAFGPNVSPQAGATMLVLSSGAARRPGDPNYAAPGGTGTSGYPGGFDKGYLGNHPAGFPKESPACPLTTTGTPHDGVALEVQVQAPSNATGFTFDFNFYTYEWPGFVCSQFNDFFVALLSPIPMGQTDGNISFDSMGNPVSVNNAFLEVCGCSGGPPCSAGGKSFACSLGPSTLVGTGFGADTNGVDRGSTDWLKTTAPVQPGETITLRWAVYDSGDGSLDSTTLVDNFEWVANGGTVAVGTTPVPK